MCISGVRSITDCPRVALYEAIRQCRLRTVTFMTVDSSCAVDGLKPSVWRARECKPIYELGSWAVSPEGFRGRAPDQGVTRAKTL